MKKIEKRRRCWKPKTSSFDECDGSGIAIGGEGGGEAAVGTVASGESSTSSGDVLGVDCDHVKNGYFSDGCFHKPSRCEVPFYRWSEPANGGSKRKKTKNRKPKKTPYEKNMKVVYNSL